MNSYKRLIPVVLAVILGITLLISACAEETAPQAEETAPQAEETAPQAEETAPQEVIKLTYADNLAPPQAFAVGSQEWFDKINKDTGGRVEITPYWGGTLVNPRNAYTELLNGVADIVAWSDSFEREGFDMDKVLTYAYYGVKDMDTAMRIHDEIQKKYPELKEEFATTKSLAIHNIAAYHVGTVNKPITKLSDFGGLTLKANGVHISILKKLGAEGVDMPMSEVYVAMQKGTLDGALTPSDTLESFKFTDLMKYFTYLNLATGPSPHRSMNLDSWNKLPPNIQKVFNDNIEWFGKRIDDLATQADIDAEKYAKEQGVQMLKLEPAELAKFYDIVGSVVSEEVDKLQAKGFTNAKAIYNDIRALVEKYK